MKTILIATTSAALLLTGCGGGSGSHTIQDPVDFMDGLWRQTNYVEPDSVTPENPSGDPMRTLTYALVQSGGSELAVYIEYADHYGIDGFLYAPACSTIIFGTVASNGKLGGELGTGSANWVGSDYVSYHDDGDNRLRIDVVEKDGSQETARFVRIAGAGTTISDINRNVIDCSNFD